MKLIALLFFIFPLASIACSGNDNADSSNAFAIKHSDSEESRISIYLPKEVKNVSLSSITISYSDSSGTLVSIPAEFHDPSAYEEGEEYDAVMATYLVARSSQVENINIIAGYTYPSEPNGEVVMCSLQRNYKLSEVIGKNF